MGTKFVRTTSVLIVVLIIAIAQFVLTTNSTEGFQYVSAFDGHDQLSEGKERNYKWSEWNSLNVGHVKGPRISFRKGDNNFAERGMVFLRIDNRSSSTLSGEFSFIIANNTNGAVSKIRSESFNMRPASLVDDTSMWFLAPGNNENPNEWDRASIAIRDIRLTKIEHSAVK